MAKPKPKFTKVPVPVTPDPVVESVPAPTPVPLALRQKRVTLRNIARQELNVLVVGSSGAARTVSIPAGFDCSMLASEFGGPHAERLRASGLLTIMRH